MRGRSERFWYVPNGFAWFDQCLAEKEISWHISFLVAQSFLKICG